MHAAQARPTTPSARQGPLTDRQEIRRLEQIVASQMNFISRRGGSAFAGLGAGVVVGAATVVQPVMLHMPWLTGVALAATGALFLVLLVVGSLAEAWLKRRAMCRLPAEVIDDLEAIHRRLYAAAHVPHGPATLEDEKNYKQLCDLLEDLLGGAWHSLRIALRHGAQTHISKPRYKPGDLERLWQQGQRSSAAKHAHSMDVALD